MVYTTCKICAGKTEEFLPQFELLKCSQCGFIFYKHQLEIAGTQELYDKLYNQQDDYKVYKQQADLLKQGKQPHLGFNKMKVLRLLLNKNCSSFIEIGAGVGVVGNYLAKKNKQYAGIELDAGAAGLARDAGLHISQGSFEDMSTSADADAVLAFEVIEHIDDLKLCLGLIRDKLKSGQYFGFTVPNFEIHYNQSVEMQKKRLGQVGPPVHVNFFTVTSLQKILQDIGFKPLYLEARPFPYIVWNKKSTYKKLWSAFKGQFKGSTIICVAKKN